MIMDETNNSMSSKIPKQTIEEVDGVYLDILLKEYEIERSKKQGLESRSGILIAILSVFSIYIIEHIEIKPIVFLFSQDTPILVWIQAMFSLLVIIFYFSTLIFSICVIGVKEQDIVTTQWKSTEIIQSHNDTLKMLIKNYIKVVANLRLLDDKKAKSLRLAYRSAVMMIILLFFKSAI